jgi:hypothetical protein
VAGAKLDASATITLKADAKDNDGTVKNVAFYVGNTLVGTANAAPYQVSVEGVEPGTHSAVAVVTDNSGLSWMSEYVTFAVEGAVVSSSSSVVEGPVASSSSRHCEEQSKDCDAAISSSSGFASETSSSAMRIVSPVRQATEAEAGFYRVFDMQGRPLYSGERKPHKMSTSRVIVVEYTTAGSVKRRYVQ